MGVAADSERLKKMVFVTVGTTCFDSLVKAVNSNFVKQELSKRGYTELLIQMGRGSYIPLQCDSIWCSLPTSVWPSASQVLTHTRTHPKLFRCSGEDGNLAVDYFTFSPSIADYLRSASLIISHAGSGSIFETLRLGKPLIVVVNEDLMDNHQSELAEELADRKHLFCARPQTLHEMIQGMNLQSLIPYPPGDAMPVVQLMNKFLGFPAD